MNPFDGSRNPKDIRTYYDSELKFMRAMEKRYACQFCGASAAMCPGCRQRYDRMAELQAEEDRKIDHIYAV